ncbi:50S ribosomal protein L3 [candidate division WWE3 bacterium]|nr:50S ribosomal protein L3 [candidate division WWE3 bacterium]
MKNELTARKVEMTQIFREDGTVVPVTVLKVEDTTLLQSGDVVTVIGTSKGKGFAGVVKRWSFAGGPKTHGQSDRHRAPGSIGGGTDPGKVWRGQRMAGRMGGARVTVKNLDVIEVRENEILLRGAVPGARHSIVKVVYNVKSAEEGVENAS